MSLSLKLPRRNPDAPRPSLRERAAALKASAAKVMCRNPASAARPPLAGAGKPSADLAALLAAHEMAYGYALYAEAYGTPDLAERRQAEEEAFRALLHSPLTSDADRAAYAAAVISRQGNSRGDDTATERDHPMAVAFRNITFGEHAREPEAMRYVGRPDAPETAPDPILAAIATSKAATAAFDAFEMQLERYGKTSGWAARGDYLSDADMKAQKAVWRTVPTTPAGRRALVEFARTQVQRRTHPDGDVDDSAWLLGLILDAFSAMVADPAGAWPAQEPAAETQAASSPLLDLSGCSVRQIARLHEALNAVAGHVSSLSQLPCFWNGNEGMRYCEYNPAGKIIDREADRLAELAQLCSDEIARREPQSEPEADDALMIRLQQELIGNGRIHDPALIRDITTTWGA